MSPADIAASLDEPNWIEQWNVLKAADDGFDALLRQWRRWHWSPVEVDGRQRKRPAHWVDGVIALAQIGIMPPSNLAPRSGVFEPQIDAHCWLISKERAWRIVGVQDRILELNSFGDKWEINLSRAKWDDYVAAASAALGGQRQ